MLAKRIVTFALLLILGNPVCCCLAEEAEETPSSCCSESHSDPEKPDDSCDCDGEQPSVAAAKLADHLPSIPAPLAIPVSFTTVSTPASLSLPPPAHASPPPGLPRNLLFEVFLI